MRLLLDTHALLWFLAADRRLGRHARAVIEAPANTVMISIVSLWEIALKSRLGKLVVDLDTVLGAIGRTDFENLGLKEAHLRVLTALPTVAEHRDPFDHLLIAQALSENLTFLSDELVGAAIFCPVGALLGRSSGITLACLLRPGSRPIIKAGGPR